MSQVRNDGGLHWRAVVSADAAYILKLGQQDFLIDWRWELREREESGMTPRSLA